MPTAVNVHSTQYTGLHVEYPLISFDLTKLGFSWHISKNIEK